MDFNKVSTQILEPDRKLAAIVGDTPRTRGEIIRKFWDYINERGLQDTDRRMINADKELQLVLGGKKQVNIFQVASLVSKHLKKPRPKKAGAQKSKNPARAGDGEKSPETIRGRKETGASETKRGKTRFQKTKGREIQSGKSRTPEKSRRKKTGGTCGT